MHDALPPHSVKWFLAQPSWWTAGILKGRAATRNEMADGEDITDAERKRHWLKAEALLEAARVEELDE